MRLFFSRRWTLRVKRHQRHDESCGCVAAKKTVALGQDNAGAGVGGAQGGAEARRSAADNQNVRLGSKLRGARRQVDENRDCSGRKRGGITSFLQIDFTHAIYSGA